MTTDQDAYSLHAAALRAITEQLRVQTAMLREIVIPSIAIVKRRASEELASHHEWTSIAVGRVCQVCRISQAESEFDDSIACAPAEVAARYRPTPDCARQ